MEIKVGGEKKERSRGQAQAGAEDPPACPALDPTPPLPLPPTVLTRARDMVTLMPRLPFSANSWAMLESNTRQSETAIAACTPSWMLRGVASHVRRRVEAVRSSLIWGANRINSASGPG